ncbi:MAG: FAD-binding oxidoreductase, partial [Chloroflexi bacterium]
MPPTDSAIELGDALRRAVRGEVRFDRLTRQIYSTDASSYRIVPAGVVTPRDVDDVAAVMEVINRYSASTVPRGGGSSLSGQTVGPGVVVDFSRHLNRVLEINPEAGWARVEAGLVLDQLNAAAAAHGLMVGPDPASSRVATLGGMSANNSTGVHSIRYGLMIDHIQAVDAVLSDGSVVHFGPKTPAEVEALARQDTLEGRLYREIPRLLAEYRDDIHQRYPRTWRNVAGYNLNRLLAAQEAGQPFNLAPLIVGSEGTLAHIVRLQVGLVPKPAHVRLVVLHFDDLRAALERVPFLLEHNPSAVELLSGHMIRLARGHAGYRQRVNRFVEGDPHSLLIVEFSGGQPAALAAARDKLVDALGRDGYRHPIIDCATPEAVSNLWSVRKDTLGLIMSMPGDAKPLSFVDDAAVPIEELAGYALEVDQVCREAGLEVAFDAHASAGCLHITPIISLKTEQGLRQMKTISQAVMKIAIAHHGTTTGEHGEGLARSYYNEQLYGPRLHRAFRQVKSLFDPHNRMNPGKIIDAPEPWDPAVLRFYPGYQTPLQPETTWFDYSPHRDMAGLVEMCNGQGLCRNLGPGVMCPSYRATRDERHATRGRANALRAALTGDLGPDGLGSHSLYEVLDLCLECKACKRECSTGVDMAKLKYEFLAQ